MFTARIRKHASISEPGKPWVVLFFQHKRLMANQTARFVSQPEAAAYVCRWFE